MVYKPVFTKTAQKSYFEHLEFLKQSYSEQAVALFVENVFKILDHLSKHSAMFPESSNFKKYRRALINRYTSMFYSISVIHHELVIHLFWNNKWNPKYLEYFLV